jgi:two-component system, LuxR family, sensor kinase FixL
MSSAAEVQTAAAASTGRDVMQTIAHELRQPLSAIESTAYYLGLVLPRTDGRAQTNVTRLRQLVEQANWILSCGLQLADQTPPTPEPVDLEEFITDTIASPVVAADPQPLLELAGSLPPVLLDPGRGRALIANVLMMFQQISHGNHPVSVRTEPDGDGVALAIFTAVPGLSSESSLGSGTALCLTSVRRTVDAHNGTLALFVDPAQGVRLRIVLPSS